MALTFDKIGVNLVVVVDETSSPAPAITLDRWGEIFEDPSPQIEALAPGLIRVLSIRQQAELVLQPGRVVIADKSAASPTSDVFPRIVSRIVELVLESGAPVKAHGYNIDLTFEPSRKRPALDELGSKLLRPEVAATLGGLRCSGTLYYDVGGSVRKLQLDSRFGKADATVVFSSLNAEYLSGDLPKTAQDARSVIQTLVEEAESTLRGLFESAA